VTWEQPEDVQRKWLWEQEHAPEPLKPLEMAMGKFSRPGAERAFAEAQVPTPALFRGGRIANGFLFVPTDLELPPEEQRALYEAVERLIQREGGVWKVWEAFSLPRIEAACASLRHAAEDTPFAEIGELYGYGMRMTHVSGSFSLFAPTFRDFSEFGDEIGVDGRRLLADLAQGRTNATFKANAALWDLSRAAERSPPVAAALLEVEPASAWDTIQALPEGQEFVRAFEAYLAQYGCRASGWSLTSPTWQEDPASPLRLIRRIVQEKPPSPEETLVEGARRRDAAKEEIEERLRGDPIRLAHFQKILEPVAHYIPIREARAYWQLVIEGIVRGLLLQRGRRLSERGAIRQTNDVFYLVPEEIESALKGDDDLTPLVDERKSKWEFWSQRRPPAVIGGEAKSGADGAAPTNQEANVIRGMAASRGAVTARARVLAHVSDADRLMPGEILVCAMTSPPWTPLFAIAGGVVTDSGGILSHPAIVAREYGIPCVVATKVSTQLIHDGAMITVDGDRGTVQIMS
jgi:phosphohistidine swiveling domain-containing protein